jgi:Cupin domain
MGEGAAVLKLPKGYAIPPHSHPSLKLQLVISGTFTLGMGDIADKSNAKPLPAGSFFAFQPGMAHYAFTDEETVVQINSTGPSGIDYVNPKDTTTMACRASITSAIGTTTAPPFCMPSI